MSRSLSEIDAHGHARAAPARREEPPGRASLGLYLATLLWGASFTWVRQGGAAVNVAVGRDTDAPFGPLLFSGWRFLLAAVLWCVLFPRSLQGWSRPSLRRGTVLGVCLFVPSVCQVVGLVGTSEAVSAFFTSLTIVFVPILSTLHHRKRLATGTWGAVLVAFAGVWLMTGATPTGFGRGEIYSFLCGLLFSVHIIAVNDLVPRDDAGRMTLAQFGVAGVFSIALAGIVGADVAPWNPEHAREILLMGSDTLGWSPRAVLGSSSVAWNLVLVTIFCTIIAFGLSFHLQPKVSPTRAAIIYLAEPVFASAFAYVILHRVLSPAALVGATLILVANVLSEWAAARSGSS